MSGHRNNPGRGGAAAFTLLEFIAASALALIVSLAAYSLLSASRHNFAVTEERVSAQSEGRGALDLMYTDFMNSGYSPLGAACDALPTAPLAPSATRARLLSDRDGDGVIGTATEAEENLTYVFVPVDGRLWTLQRGIDLNGDGDFVDPDESVEVLAERVVAIDGDGNGSVDPFLVYDPAPPATTRVRVSFGVEIDRARLAAGRPTVTPFTTIIHLRNQGS